MKITFSAYDRMYSVETKNDDVNFGTVVELFVGLMLSAGFARETIQEWIPDEGVVYSNASKEEDYGDEARPTSV